MQRLALRAADEGASFRALVEADPAVTAALSGATVLEGCFDDRAALRHVDTVIARLEALDAPAWRRWTDEQRPGPERPTRAVTPGSEPDPADASGSPGRRALVSVSDKRGLLELAGGLVERGWQLVSTGGTARAIRDAGLPVTDVAAVTGAPEMLDGRVKTLHPRIAGGVLADLRLASHREQLAEQGIEPFALVIVNLYRFEEAAARPGIDDDELIEEIDIGGPTLVRAAAKNHASVGIVCDPDDYPGVLAELDERGALTDDTRRALALKAFRLTAAYDAAIAATLSRRWAPEERFPERLSLGLSRAQLLRYGENPHQAAALYTLVGCRPISGALRNGRDARGRQAALLQQPARRCGRRGPGPRPAGRRGRHRQARQSLRRG